MRDYDPTLGAYVQADPLGLVDGPNVYRYALANPGRYVDPRGTTTLIIYRKRGTMTVIDGGQTFSVPITTGRTGEYLNNPSLEHVRDHGALPAGTYTAIPSELSDPEGFMQSTKRRLTGDWGDWRIPLHCPNDACPYGRDGFFIHGGANPGSAGCIDVGGGGYRGDTVTDKIKDFILRDHDGSVTVIVE